VRLNISGLWQSRGRSESVTAGDSIPMRRKGGVPVAMVVAVLETVVVVLRASAPCLKPERFAGTEDWIPC